MSQTQLNHNTTLTPTVVGFGLKKDIANSIEKDADVQTLAADIVEDCGKFVQDQIIFPW